MVTTQTFKILSRAYTFTSQTFKHLSSDISGKFDTLDVRMSPQETPWDLNSIHENYLNVHLLFERLKNQEILTTTSAKSLLNCIGIFIGLTPP